MSSLWGGLGGLGDWAQQYGTHVSKSALADKLEQARESRAEAREDKRVHESRLVEDGKGGWRENLYNSKGFEIGSRQAAADKVQSMMDAKTKAEREGKEWDWKVEDRPRDIENQKAVLKSILLGNTGKQQDNDYNAKYRPKLAESTLASQTESRRASRESSARAERASKDKASASEDTSTEEDTIAKLAKWAKDNPALTVPGILTEDGKALTPEGQRAARDAVDMARQMKITLQEAFMQLMGGDVMRVRHSDVVLPTGKK